MALTPLAVVAVSTVVAAVALAIALMAGGVATVIIIDNSDVVAYVPVAHLISTYFKSRSKQRLAQ